MNLNSTAAIALGAYVIFMIGLLQYQLHRLRCNDTNATVTVGFARLVGDLMRSKETGSGNERQLQSLLETLEHSTLKAIRLCVFDEHGDVLMDSSDPCCDDHLKASAPNSRQQELLDAVKHAKPNTDTKSVFQGTLYRPCGPKSTQPELTSFAALQVEGKVVVATACGS